MVRALSAVPRDLCTPHGWTNPRTETPGGHLARDESSIRRRRLWNRPPLANGRVPEADAEPCARKTLD